MESKAIKTLSQAAFVAGVAAVVLSGATYILGRTGKKGGNQNLGQFIGLWAPTLFTLAEMLDRVSIEDKAYLGVKIKGHHDADYATPERTHAAMR